MNKPSSSLLTQDLDFIFQKVGSLWENLRGKNIFITGATGFFGCWLLESLLWANDKLALHTKIFILTRHKINFYDKYPHLAKNTALTILEGHVENFKFPDIKIHYIIHAATDTTPSLTTGNTIIQGTKHVLEFAKHSQVKQMLFTSSGAVYESSHLSHIPESHPCLPYVENGTHTYATGKSAAEHLIQSYAKLYNLDIKIARCFAFVGPYLSLTSNFAIANFIHCGLKNEEIIIQGDGTTYRSYLYAADLMIWLWTILFKGETCRPYNVGSDQAISIKELAQLVSTCFEHQPAIKIMTPVTNSNPERYVPSIHRAAEELGLRPEISLVKAIQSTIQWHRSFGEFEDENKRNVVARRSLPKQSRKAHKY